MEFEVLLYIVCEYVVAGFHNKLAAFTILAAFIRAKVVLCNSTPEKQVSQLWP